MWEKTLQKELDEMAGKLIEKVRPLSFPGPVIRPEDMGCLDREKATGAIQQAVDRAAELGGGVVTLENGDYVSGTITLKSHVCLRIQAGARLLGSTDLSDYPEHHAQRLTVQDTSMGMHQSLIVAEGCSHIGICGPGVISGRGFREHFPGEETSQGTPGRPFVMRLIDCDQVYVHDVTLENSPCWMQNYLNCEDVLLENITVRNLSNYNNDGFDIDGCRRVVVRNCDVQSLDDALCFKGAAQSLTRDVLVENCRFFSACNAVKFGTDTQGDFRNVLIRSCEIGGLREDPSGLKHKGCDSAVSVEMMDGGTLERVLMEDLTVTGAWSPFFFRLEDRGRVKPGDPVPGPGTLRTIVIRNCRGTDNGPRGSYMLGAPEKAIENVTFENISLTQHASGKPVLSESEIGEMKGVYPDAHMIDSLGGDAPAYGLWARHVKGLKLDHYEITPESEEKRPFTVLSQDVTLA